MSVSYFTALGRIVRAAAEESRPAYADRLDAYAAWEAYYHNTIYERLSDGGQREQVNATLGNASAADLAGLYNPVAEVVDLYQHVYGGQFRASDEPQGNDTETDVRAVPGRTADAARILPALDQLWSWSNMNLLKQPYLRLGATHGTVGLRIVAENHPDPTRRRVYLKAEHPRLIRDVEIDARGNVTAIELEYEHTHGIGDDQATITVREVLTKSEIRTYRVEQGQVRPYDLTEMRDGGPNSAYPNALGVVPYVLAQHQGTGEAFGLNAFYRARSAIDRLNALLTHLNTQIHDHVKVDWFIAAAGPAPTRIALDGRSVIYVDTRLSAGQAPVMQPMVAPLNLADAISQGRLLIGLIEDRLPELKAVSGTYLSGQSGETIAQLRAPAEHRLGLARASYDDALVRAAQIALSWGVLLELWDLGTGQGSAEAAERAYREGREDFRLNERALLPPTGTGAQPATTTAPPAMPAPPAAVPLPSQQGATPNTEDAEDE
jgi:hypothetical protein